MKQGNRKEYMTNRQSSVLLFKCRTNTLNLTDRKRFKGEDMKCQLCGYDKENLNHFLLWCAAYSQPRQRNKNLHQPYEEDQEKIIGKLLFQDDARETKETIYEFWKIREKCTSK